MIERWCSWHKPAGVLLEQIADGKVEILKTHGICPDCLLRPAPSQAGLQLRPGALSIADLEEGGAAGRAVDEWARKFYLLS
jgi:hypothetical protein